MAPGKVRKLLCVGSYLFNRDGLSSLHKFRRVNVVLLDRVFGAAAWRPRLLQLFRALVDIVRHKMNPYLKVC